MAKFEIRNEKYLGWKVRVGVYHSFYARFETSRSSGHNDSRLPETLGCQLVNANSYRMLQRRLVFSSSGLK